MRILYEATLVPLPCVSPLIYIELWLRLVLGLITTLLRRATCSSPRHPIFTSRRPLLRLLHLSFLAHPSQTMLNRSTASPTDPSIRPVNALPTVRSVTHSFAPVSLVHGQVYASAALSLGAPCTETEQWSAIESLGPTFSSLPLLPIPHQPEPQ